MINRHDAVLAREGMENYKSGDMQLRTRWGVGFGPRDCSDYQTGVSVIPIDRLTDADRKWMLTAEYGGTGGKPIQTGMVVEEPDIEIGAGVSSKAISRRMATDTGGKRGPVSSRGAERFRRDRVNEFSGGMDNHNYSNPNANAWGGHGGAGPGAHGHHGHIGNYNDPRAGQSYADRGANDSPSGNAGAIGVPPAVPGFGYSFPGMPAMFPGFMMGGGNGNGNVGAPGQGDGQGQTGNGQ
ncbi:hypothetical protein KEM54_000498 [Ascosphaera aggregata]|nr:hypothetical protein KEM54_000498 [Ascosphaera aggregata]